MYIKKIEFCLIDFPNRIRYKLPVYLKEMIGNKTLDYYLLEYQMLQKTLKSSHDTKKVYNIKY